MSHQRLKEKFAPGEPIPARWLSEVARRLNALETMPPLMYDDDTLLIDPTAPGAIVPVKITGAKSGSYYSGSVYADGVDATATETSQNIWLNGFEVNSADTQGYYMAMAVSRVVGGSVERAFLVLPGYPIPPATGVAYLISDGGVVKWSTGVDCTGTPV